MERFKRFFRLGTRDVRQEVDDELAFHLAMKERELIRGGCSPEEARERARRAFGDRAAIGRECVEIQSEHARRRVWRGRYEGLARDVRLALRSLRRSPRFTGVIVLTLALGIGATVTVFSMLDTLLLEPLPYPEQERLGLLFERRPAEEIERDRFSFHQYREIVALQESFDATAAFTLRGRTLTGEAPAERVGTVYTSSSLFGLVGAVPAHGRLLNDVDDRPGAPASAVLSHGLWQRRFGGDPAVVGRSITLNGQEVPVVGVLPPDFREDVMRMWAGPADVFLNLSPVSPDYGVLSILVRKRAGASWEQAEEDMERIAAGMAERRGTELHVDVVPLLDEVAGEARPALVAMFGAAGILLLITCANVSTLLLSRAPEREREMALCSALGGSPRQILRRAAVEHLLIALAGAALAVAVVMAVQAGLRSLSPEVGWIADRSFGGWTSTPWLRNVAIDARVVGFTGAVALVTSFLFGMAPAVRASRADPGGLLKGEDAIPYSFPGTRTRVGVRDALTVGQVALALVLLIGAGLLVRSFFNARHADLGFDPEGLLSLYVNPSGAEYENRQAVVAFYVEALERIEALPGVEGAAVVDGLPLTGGVGWTSVQPEQGALRPGEARNLSLMRHVSPGYFRVMGIPLRAGRVFDEKDREDAPTAIVVDERLARRFWPGEDPLGKRLFEAWGEGKCAAGCLRGEVVGVVAPVRYQPLEADPWIAFYDPVAQVGDGGHGVYLVVRTASAPGASIPAVRHAIQAVDADQPLIDVRTMEDRLDAVLVTRRLSALVLQSFAALALILALVGLYGTISYGVSRARHTIAIRMVLGARRSNVTGHMLHKAFVLTGAGVALGLVAAVALTRLLGSVLYGVAATDAGTFIVLSLLLLGTGFLAAVGPARRAAKVDPMTYFRTT